MRRVVRLSKSQFLSGLQCPKMLWWMVHEPSAPELAADEELQRILERGRRVGELARTYVPGGVHINLPHHEIERRVSVTARAIADGASIIYEASFLKDGLFVAVDILERHRDGFGLVEVKSALDIKDRHIPDVAFQTHVIRRAGLAVKRAEVMHLNRECRHPDLSNLFVRENVTTMIRAATQAVPKQAARLRSILAGPLPEVAMGPHCNTPYSCPFLQRCSSSLPEHHVSTLYKINNSTVAKLIADGIQTLYDLPPEFATSAITRRQLHSVRTGKIVVELGLLGILAAMARPLAFLDFETVSPAIPVWPGCRPYDQVPVQFSCHLLKRGRLEHRYWLANGPADPRESFARALVAACASAKTVLAFNAPFEQRCINKLVETLPDLRDKLQALSRRICDLLPIMREHVYHPDFGGSFSIKKVLPALVPELGYDDLAIRDGSSASVALETLLLDAGAFTVAQRQCLRRDLLRYCERDTLGMVRLYEQLLILADEQRPHGRTRQRPRRG